MELDFDLYVRMSQEYSTYSETYSECVLAQLAKASEELGETSSAFLTYAGFNPRKDSNSVTMADVKSEVTDTIGTLLVLLTIFSSDPERDLKLMQEKFSLRLKESQERL